MLSLRLLFFLNLLPWGQARTQDQIPIKTTYDNPSVHTDATVTENGNYGGFNFSSPSPYIFSSVHGLLQQWSNTFFPNGHSIVPCQIPAFTNLYHGRQDSYLPESPEWFAFDIEMSYGIMGSFRNSHILTYQTTRSIGCLYFDGESATLMGTGQMDTQMLFIYGNVTGPRRDDGRRFRGLEDEYQRASGLCQWIQSKSLGGAGWGIEGIVRMNAGFEMIWCNFTSPSIKLLTRVNVTVPMLPLPEEEAIYSGHTVAGSTDEELGRRRLTTERSSTSVGYYPLPTEVSPPDHSKEPDQPPMPPTWRRNEQEPFLFSQAWGWFESATWHYGSNGRGAGRGESRIRPLTCGFLTFYDSAYNEQLNARVAAERQKLNLTIDGLWQGPGAEEDRNTALEQLMRRRRYHLLRNISDIDALSMNTAAERVLRNLKFDSPTISKYGLVDDSNCTGIDWSVVTSDIVQRYAPRLQQLKSVLNAGSNVDMGNSTAVKRWFSGLRQHTHYLFMPYLEYPLVAHIERELSLTSAVGQLTLSRCRYHYTRLLAPDQYFDKLTSEEALLVSTIEETLGAICSWVVNAGFAVEREWFDRFDGHSSVHNTKADDNSMTLPSLTQHINEWKAGLEELMAWLGWVDQWTYCKDGCEQDEVCFLPMWPMDTIDRPGQRFRPDPGRGRDRPPGRPPGGGHGDDTDRNGMPHTIDGPSGGPPKGPPSWGHDEEFLWEPKCIKTEYTKYTH